MRRLILLVLVLLTGLKLWAQTLPQTSLPQLSPEAAYDQAVRPVEIVRRSMANWSDSELGAFTIAMKRAATECSARKPERFSGDDLISLARLCSLGQQWEVMGAAAGLYIDTGSGLKPQLATAYGFRLEAELHKRDVLEMLVVEKAMLAAVPYDAVVDTVTNEVLSYLQLAYTDDALNVHAMRQPLLLAALRTEKPLLAKNILYADGLAEASLEQYAGQTDAALKTATAFDDALGSNLPADDSIPVSLMRQQYALLGKPLPPIHYELTLEDVRQKPHINPDLGAATALLLYPDWCTQCIRMAPDLWDAMGRLGEETIRVYGLVAEVTPDKAALLIAQMKPQGLPPPLPPGQTAPESKPRTPSELLLHTPTLVVPPETLKTFAAADYPFLIVVDHRGIVRFASPAPESVLQPGDFLDRVAHHVAEQWPAVNSREKK